MLTETLGIFSSFPFGSAATRCGAVKKSVTINLYHDRMGFLKRRFLLGLLLLLVSLQGVMPFLHAHTGLSTLSGIHTADTNVSQFQTRNTSYLELASRSDEESFVVQVGAGLSNEDKKITFGFIALARNFGLNFAKPNLSVNLPVLLVVANWLCLTFYSSETYPPPALAPPAQTL